MGVGVCASRRADLDADHRYSDFDAGSPWSPAVTHISSRGYRLHLLLRLSDVSDWPDDGARLVRLHLQNGAAALRHLRGASHGGFASRLARQSPSLGVLTHAAGGIHWRLFGRRIRGVPLHCPAQQRGRPHAEMDGLSSLVIIRCIHRATPWIRLAAHVHERGRTKRGWATPPAPLLTPHAAGSTFSRRRGRESSLSSGAGSCPPASQC